MNLRDAIAALTSAGVPDPAGDARRLFDWAYAQGGQPAEGQVAPLWQDRENPNDVTRAAFDGAIKDRMARRPVSHIIGRRAFWRHDFTVTGAVLDPRPDTETLVEQALMTGFTNVLDLGTGSGAIIVSLLDENGAALGVGTDISPAALDVAQGNAARIGVSERLRLIQSNWFADVDGQFDLIVSNPPYITAQEMAELAPEVRDWEPHIALTPGGDGLDAYRIIAAGAAVHLTEGGHLMVEIGATQAQAVTEMFRAAGLGDISVIADLNGRDRVVSAKRGQSGI